MLWSINDTSYDTNNVSSVKYHQDTLFCGPSYRAALSVAPVRPSRASDFLEAGKP